MTASHMTSSIAAAEGEKRVPSVDRAIDMLEYLSSSSHPVTLSEISRMLEIPKSSAYYLLHTLWGRGYLQRTANGQSYFLGARLAMLLGDPSLTRVEIRKVCSPHLRALSRRLHLVAHAAVQEGCEGVIVDKHDEGGLLPTGDYLGRHFDLHCTALGKAMIMLCSDSEIEKLFRHRGLPRHNSNTLSSLAALKEDLAKDKVRGYAVNDEEHTLGCRAVASPIVNSSGKVIAAISLHGPSNELPDWRVATVAKEILGVAREIAAIF